MTDYTPTIDWLHGEKRPRPKNPTRQDMFYPCTCWRCGRERMLRKHDALKASKCGTCQRSEAGKLGQAAAVKKHGNLFHIKHVAEYQHRHPSKPERRVRKWLKQWGITFEDSVIFERWILDIVIDSLAIEVYGYWHKRTRIERDQAVAAAWQGRFFFLDADLVMNDPDAAQAQLKQAIGIGVGQ
jgi:hypothetical protein